MYFTVLLITLVSVDCATVRKLSRNNIERASIQSLTLNPISTGQETTSNKPPPATVSEFLDPYRVSGMVMPAAYYITAIPANSTNKPEEETKNRRQKLKHFNNLLAVPGLVLTIYNAAINLISTALSIKFKDLFM